MVEIRDREQLEAWLEGRAREDAIAIAARAAQRAVPMISRIFESSLEEPRANFVLPALRATLSASVAASQATDALSVAKAARSASFAADSAADSALAARSAAFVAARSAAFAADSASASASSAADSASALFAAFAADSAASASFAAEIWDAIAADAIALEAGMEPMVLATSALWPDGPPDWVAGHWAVVTSALREALGEDWKFWISWYEARLRGGPGNEALERAVVLIDDGVWEQGPAVANAEIRRLVEVHRPTRTQLEETVSPQPVIEDGKLDVQPNEKYDAPDGSEELATLPTRQRAIIRALLAALTGDRNTSPAVVVALQEYDTELLARGTRPMLGLLNDMHQIVRDEYRVLNKEKFFDSQGGLKRSFLGFSANHKTIKEHFPLDAERELLVREASETVEVPEPTALRDMVNAVSTATQDAFDEGGLSDDYRRVMDRLTDDMRRVVETPLRDLEDDEDRSIMDAPEVPWWKRRIISMRGFAGKTISRVAEAAGIIAFFETEKGKAFAAVLQKLVDLLWPGG